MGLHALKVNMSAEVESAVGVIYATCLIARPLHQTSNGYFGATPRQIQPMGTATVRQEKHDLALVNSDVT